MVFDQVCRANGPHFVLRNASCVFPSRRRIGILGGRGSGKTTLVRLLGGALVPSSGRIRREGSISPPIGYAGGLSAAMSGRGNVRFLARLYGIDPHVLSDYVCEFSGLGDSYDQPLATYSGEKRAKLTFTLSYALPFDTYLADEALIGGSGAFRTHLEALTRDRLRQSGLILVTRSPTLLQVFCEDGGVLLNGRIEMCGSIGEAIRLFRRTYRAADAGHDS